MTSELRPAVEVWRAARDAWLSGNLGVGPNGFRLGNREAAAAVIEADREAVRAEQAAHLQAKEDGLRVRDNRIKLIEAELAKFKALAETLAGELQQIEVDAMEYYNEWRETGCDQKDAIRFAFGLGEETREALRQYKEATNV